MEILKYEPQHGDDVLAAIGKDPDWDMFTNADAIDVYRESLNKSIAYVCYDNNEFCGYVRALPDGGLAVYISELYVVPTWRNHKIGQSLMERVIIDFSNLTVYALSDEDLYYEKKGYRKIGSVFQLN